MPNLVMPVELQEDLEVQVVVEALVLVVLQQEMVMIQQQPLLKGNPVVQVVVDLQDLKENIQELVAEVLLKQELLLQVELAEEVVQEHQHQLQEQQ